MRLVGGRGFLALGVACALLVGGSAARRLVAQEGSDFRLITMQSIKVREDGKKRILEVKADASELPVGCKVIFRLTWRYQTIQRYQVEVPASKKFQEEFIVPSYTPSPEPYVMFTQLLEPKEQPKAVQKEIEGDAKRFPPGAVPWAEEHHDHSFVLGTEEEIRAETARIQGWFKERYEQLATLDKLISDQLKAVKEGTALVDSKGELEEKKWRSMMDGQVLEPIRALQKEIAEGLKGERGDLISYRRPLAELRELTNAVALRAVERSIALYKEKGLEPSALDVTPKELDTAVRGFKRNSPKGSDLQKMVRRIEEALGIAPPPESAEPPKEPGSTGGTP